MLAASIEGGTFSSTQERWFDAGSDLVTATSDPDGNYLSAHVRANQRFSFGSTFIDPTIDFGATRIHQNGYSEQGAGAVSYTHLDVYKRQPRARTAGASSPAAMHRSGNPAATC